MHATDIHTRHGSTSAFTQEHRQPFHTNTHICFILERHYKSHMLAVGSHPALLVSANRLIHLIIVNIWAPFLVLVAPLPCGHDTLSFCWLWRISLQCHRPHLDARRTHERIQTPQFVYRPQCFRTPLAMLSAASYENGVVVAKSTPHSTPATHYSTIIPEICPPPTRYGLLYSVCAQCNAFVNFREMDFLRMV